MHEHIGVRVRMDIYEAGADSQALRVHPMRIIWNCGATYLPNSHNLAALNEDGAHLRRISKPVKQKPVLEKYRDLRSSLCHVLYYLLRLQVLYPPVPVAIYTLPILGSTEASL